MKKNAIQNKIKELLTRGYYCTLEDLNKNEVVYSIKPDAEQPYIKIMAYRNCVLVCTSEDLHTTVKELTKDKNRDEIFEIPFVYGQTIHYVPDISGGNYVGSVTAAQDYDCEYIWGKEILKLNGLTGFENSLAFDREGLTPTEAVYVARHYRKIIGVAGAAKSSVEGVREVGVDVIKKYRNAGLGTYLVRNLTRELLTQNMVPFYSASVTNIGSQMVAYKCGYMPVWVDTFGTTLDGSYAYHDIVKRPTQEKNAG